MIHPQENACVLPGATQMREPWLTFVYPLGAGAGTNQEGIGSNNAAVTFDGLASTPPFDGATLPDGGDRTLPASSSSSIDLTGMAQQEQRNLLVPSQEFRDLIFPTIVRHTIGTPAMIASADSRLVHRRKHGCYICGSKFTTCD